MVGKGRGSLQAWEARMDLTNLDWSSARDGLLRKTFSCEEYVGELVAVAERLTTLHGWVEFDSAALLTKAREADQSGVATDPQRRLGGLPLGVKDNIDVVGMRCSAGTGALAQRRPKRDAQVITYLKDEGAFVAGKTVLHELAMGATSNNAVTGAARNPYDASRSPGGSSGGSGTVVGARMVPVALGTDTGGSVRVPAALCGIAGLRPTTGRYPGRGVLPLSHTRDTVGPLARSVADLALLDEIITQDNAWPHVELSGLRVGVPRDIFTRDVDPAIGALFEGFVSELGRLGVHLIEAELPERDEINGQIGFPIVLFETEQELLGVLAEEGNPITLQALYDGIGSPDVAAIVRQQLGPDKITPSAYAQALRRRNRLQSLYAEHYRQHGLDAMIFPTCPLTAPRIEDDVTVKLNGRDVPTFLAYIRHTDPGSVAGLPGISIPLGLVDGLPVGLALEGTPHTDRFLLALSQRFEQMLPRIDPPGFA